MNVIPTGILATWWPVLVILFGLNQLFRHPGRPWGAIFIIVVGILLQLWKLTLLPANLWALIVALLLIVLGVRLVVPHRRGRIVVSTTPTTTQSRDRINESLSFGSLNYRDDAQQFQGGKVSVSFGKYELDLRGAKISPSGADLELDASFGEIDVRVPEDLVVITAGSPVFGSCTNKARITELPATEHAVLRVKCAAQFGSVVISN